MIRISDTKAARINVSQEFQLVIAIPGRVDPPALEIALLPTVRADEQLKKGIRHPPERGRH
jgi:hypothetical protein